MRLLAAAGTLSLYVVVTTMGESLLAQGVWTVGFDHLPNNFTDANATTPLVPPQVHPASDSIANPGRWITRNLPAAQQVHPNVPGFGMNTVHVCLIPAGVHRGEVLVWDGNLTLYGVRAYQPWSIVNPYWPALNPNYWPGQVTPQYRFHNATLAMPIVPASGQPEGELFCAGQCWMADGRLLVCGGTSHYPPPSPPGAWFHGTKFVYLWDHVPTSGNPFGTWWSMAPRELEFPRWYPTVTFYGTADHRGVVMGGTNWTATSGLLPVNSYEVVRPAFGSTPPQLSFPNPFDTKPTATFPIWPTGPASNRQYWGPAFTFAHFGDYPRVHTLGILEPIAGGTAPRLFVSGFFTQGIRWAHDSAADPVFSAGGQGFEIGQMPLGDDNQVHYGTSLLVPGLPGGISTQVARIGGYRIAPAAPGPSSTPGPSKRVETVAVNISPPTTSAWLSTGAGSIPPMHYHRMWGNVVQLPTGDWFAIGGADAQGNYNLIPELLVGGTAWYDMAPHAGARDYHSAAILLPDARVFVCGGERRKLPPSGPDYLIWEPPYFNLSEGPTGITVRNEATSVSVEQHLIGPLGMQYGQTYRADWTNTLEAGTSISVVLIRPAALTHHDDGGQRMVRLNAWDDGTPNSVVFQSPASVQHAQNGWWMLFLVSSDYRPSKAYWVHLL